MRYLKDVFNKNPDKMSELVNFREDYGGNQALHFAVLKGNHRIVDMILNDFHASP